MIDLRPPLESLLEADLIVIRCLILFSAVLDLIFVLAFLGGFCADLRLGSGEASGFRRHGAGELFSSPPSVCSGFVVNRPSHCEEICACVVVKLSMMLAVFLASFARCAGCRSIAVPPLRWMLWL